jgi:hypothetical protein
MGPKKFALAAAKATPAGYAVSKIVGHAQAEQGATPPPAKIKTVAELQYSPGGLSNAGGGTKIRLLANGTIIRKDVVLAIRGGHAVLDPDLQAGLVGRKHTTGVTITLIDGQVLTWQSTSEGHMVRFDQSQAHAFVLAFNKIAADKNTPAAAGNGITLTVEQLQAKVADLQTVTWPDDARRLATIESCKAILARYEVAPAAGRAAEAPESSVAQKLTELAALHTSGILTDDEFAAKRTTLVAQL